MTHRNKKHAVQYVALAKHVLKNLQKPTGGNPQIRALFDDPRRRGFQPAQKNPGWEKKECWLNPIDLSKIPSLSGGRYGGSR